MKAKSFLDVKKDIESTCRKNIYKTCILIATIVTFSEAAFLLQYNSGNHFANITVPYLMRHLFVPSMAIWISILFVFLMFQSSYFEDSTKNHAVCILLFIICTVLELSHYSYLPILFIHCIAIFVTVIFINITLSKNMCIISFFVVGYSVYNSYVTGNSDKFMALATLAVVYTVTFCSFLFVKILSQYQKEQLTYISQNFSRQQELMEEMKIDVLTGLYNRKALKDNLARTVKISKSIGSSPIMAILDLDLFKQINDTYGHSNGDEILANLGSLMKYKLNGKATAYRYGGEEFIILFDKQREDQAYEIAEDIRTSFEKLDFSFMSGKHVSLSCGLASFHYENTEKGWIDKADCALYQAKNAGRNRTLIYREEMNSSL